MIHHTKERTRLQDYGLILGFLLFLCILFFGDLDPANIAVTRMAAIAVLIATWWITEAIPLAATALLPLVLFPILGISSAKEIAPAYLPSILFLFIGGFMIALAMEKWNLHKRIALTIVNIFNGSPTKIILGFMIATAFLSMWISNTATTVMMVPIGLAIIYKLEDSFGEIKTHHFSVALMLGIAYSASIGGISTLVGTPPNLSFVRIFEISFPELELISFGKWMLIGLPISITMIFICWVILTKFIFRFDASLKIDKSVIESEKSALNKISYEEKIVFTVFIVTALLWIFRKDLNLGFIVIPGWSNILEFPSYIDDGVVAIFMSIVLFIIPGKSDTEKKNILDSTVFAKIPWAIILLFGGGFALAKGMKISGLSEYIGAMFSDLEGSHPIAIISGLSFGITFLTELTSNMATTEMILPLLATISESANINPLIMMIPATISASCAFMLPAATAPNAIVFGSERITIAEMVKAGILLNIIGIIIVTFFCYLILPLF